MKQNQIHEEELSHFNEMTLEEAVTHLDGKVVFFNRLGFDVAYCCPADLKSKQSIWATVSDHYTHAHPRQYLIHLMPNTTGQQIFDQTYVALASYIRKEGTHDVDKSKKFAM